jgi:two-component system chemotaxis response regulator CheY
VAKILVVDDSLLQRMNLNRFYSSQGHKVVEADCGEIAIKLIEEQSFDLVTLDLLMPNITGIDVLEHFHKKVHTPPIIILTADIQPTIFEECNKYGCTEFLNKPIRADELFSVTNKILGL